ncbi:MAG: acyltransferase [Streptosporangiaceae bacterium]
MRSTRRDPRQARFLTWASVRWVLRHRAFTPWYLLRYWRFTLLKLRNPHIVTEGFVFLGKGVEVHARRGYGRLVLGPFVHVGDGTAIRCHEGNVRIGDRCVFGGNDTVNAYLDVEFGESVLVADGVYVCDFDHGMADIHVPIKDQGIVKSPVRVGPGVWLGNRVTVTRGVAIGRGCAVGAHAVVAHDLPEYSVAVGVPARVVCDRVDTYEAAAERRAALARMADEQRRALARAVDDRRG